MDPMMQALIGGSSLGNALGPQNQAGGQMGGGFGTMQPPMGMGAAVPGDAQLGGGGFSAPGQGIMQNPPPMGPPPMDPMMLMQALGPQGGMPPPGMGGPPGPMMPGPRMPGPPGMMG